MLRRRPTCSSISLSLTSSIYLYTSSDRRTNFASRTWGYSDISRLVYMDTVISFFSYPCNTGIISLNDSGVLNSTDSKLLFSHEFFLLVLLDFLFSCISVHSSAWITLANSFSSQKNLFLIAKVLASSFRSHSEPLIFSLSTSSESSSRPVISWL